MLQYSSDSLFLYNTLKVAITLYPENVLSLTVRERDSALNVILEEQWLVTVGEFLYAYMLIYVTEVQDM
jgi:hypothetical protein